MADNKKYYYLRLKENFYDTDEIKILESMPNGYKYSNILLKLYLKSLKNNGALRVNEYIPYNTEMITAVTGHDTDTVKVAMDIFKRLKLIEIMENGTIYILDIQSFIGKTTTESDRIRIYRNEIENKKKLIEKNVTNVQQMNNIITPKIELELDLELKKELDIKKDKESEEPCPPKPKKEVKHKYGEYNHVMLTDKEYQSLITDFKEILIKEYIVKIDLYMEQYGNKKYKNFNLTIRNWIGRDGGKNGSTGQNTKASKGEYTGFKPKKPKLTGNVDYSGLI